MNSVWDFLVLYRWAATAGFSMSVVLAVLGVHLAARDRAMQTVCVGQGAMLGVLVALGCMGAHEAEGLSGIVPICAAALGAAVAYYFTLVGARERASQNSYFAAMFGVLLALGALVTAFFPMLESHMSHIYFGDLATLSDDESQACLALAFGLGLWLWLGARRLTRQSFEISVFGKSSLGVGTRDRKVFDFLCLVAVGVSVQYLGFLFTISALFLPTVLAARSPKAGWVRHLLTVVVIAGLGSLLGFWASLANTRLATVASIVVAMFLVGTLGIGFQRMVSSRPK